jgi:acyl-CoA synthetase (AMP-forming)/AMP-acid ligase II
VRLLVDVGGIKVNPIEVEAVLARHPGVRDAVVVPVRVSDVTARLKAVIVPEPGRAPTKAELRRFAREHLVHYKVPRSFEIRATVPRSSSGKILRKELEPGPAPRS